MSKLKGVTKEGDKQSHKVKRRKLDHKDAGDSHTEIPHTLRDLQNVLTFQQDSSAELRNGTDGLFTIYNSFADSPY
jgi:hypothetical protein